MAHVYGERVADFRRHERIALHPAHPLYMTGARYGAVYGRGRKYVRVKLDKIARVQMILPGNLRKV